MFCPKQLQLNLDFFFSKYLIWKFESQFYPKLITKALFFINRVNRELLKVITVKDQSKSLSKSCEER
jgi:hypothetical protein